MRFIYLSLALALSVTMEAGMIYGLYLILR